MRQLAEQLKTHQLYLEDFNEWLGEPAPYKYIVLGVTGQHLAYGNTLSEIEQAIAHLI